MLSLVNCPEWMLNIHNNGLKLQASISNIAATGRQLLVCTQRTIAGNSYMYVNTTQLVWHWTGVKLGHVFLCYAEINLSCVALAILFSGFQSGCPLIEHWTVMLISSLLWEIFSSLDSGLLATAVKMSKSCHNSKTKPLIQNSPILRIWR